MPTMSGNRNDAISVRVADYSNNGDNNGVTRFISDESGRKGLRISDKLKDVDFASIIGISSSLLALTGDLTKIYAGTRYVVDFPPEILKGLKNGTLEFGRKADGKMLAQVLKKSADGRNLIYKNLTISPEQCFDFTAALASVSNICVQIQLKQIAETVKKIYDVCQRIERGQQHDRIALLDTGREQLLNALKYKDKAHRDHEIQNAINNLTLGKNEIGYYLKDRCENFGPVTANTFLQVLKSWSIVPREISGRPSPYDRKIDEVNEIDDIYSLYCKAVRMISMANVMLGENEAAEVAVEESGKFLSTIDFSKIQTIKYVDRKEDLSDAFFNNPLGRLQETKKAIGFLNEPCEYVELEISGDRLLEAAAAE